MRRINRQIDVKNAIKAQAASFLNVSGSSRVRSVAWGWGTIRLKLPLGKDVVVDSHSLGGSNEKKQAVRVELVEGYLESEKDRHLQ